MSIKALILGKLHQRAEQRTGKTGRPFVTAKVRAAAGDGESLFVNVIAFADTASAALLTLDACDSVELAGTLKPGAWTDREGNARPSLDIVAAQVLTLYALKKKREANAQARDRQHGQTPREHPAGDAIGHDDDWPAGDAA